MGYPDEVVAPLLDESSFVGALETLPLGMARQFHACTHTTIAPTVVHGGTKTNVIPDTVDLELDIRTLPGQVEDDVRRLLDEAIGDLARQGRDHRRPRRPVDGVADRDTAVGHVRARRRRAVYPTPSLVPFLTVGATDARFFRREGQTAYGFGLFSRHLTLEDYGTMFHGDDERVDVESLRLSTELWEAVAAGSARLDARIRAVLVGLRWCPVVVAVRRVRPLRGGARPPDGLPPAR